MSVGSLTFTTVPCSPKASPTAFSSASNDKLPTNRVSEGGLVESPNCLARLSALSFGPSLDLGVEKSTLALRPSISWSFLAARAAAAEAELENSTYPNPLERPLSRSVMMFARVISPNSSNSRYSHSSSTFQLRLPMNRFLLPLSSTASVLDFLADATGSSSALRFLEGASVSAAESSESDSESDPDASESSSEPSESDSASDS